MATGGGSASPSGSAALRVLVVHRGVLARDAEAAEVEQQVLGLLSRPPGQRAAEVWVSDCRFLYRAVLHDGELAYCRTGRLRRGSLEVDVAQIHMPVPLPHLAAAVLLRLRRVPVVLSPMGMLGDDYARSTWSLGRRSALAVGKPAAIVVLRGVWRLLAQRFVCISLDEARLAHLPRQRSAGVPWPVPSTGLGRAAAQAPAGDQAGAAAAAGPVAFVSRFDVHRKGIDRLAR